MIRIATWNVNSLRVRLPHVLQWIKDENPDILALQETKVINEDFPENAFLEQGYQVVCNGQKTFNGVALISKEAPVNIITALPGYDDQQKRVLCADVNGITVLNLYVPNGSEVGSEKYQYKLEWLSRLHEFVLSLGKDNENIVMLGDFNIAPEDQDVHDPAEWEGHVLVSAPERAEFRRLLTAGFADCFRVFKQAEKSYSWWDYRAAAFRRNRGLRIDHILASQALVTKCRNCRIDKSPRSLDRPSDHVPVIAEFDI